MLSKLLRNLLQDGRARYLNARAGALWRQGNLRRAESGFRAAIGANARYAPAYGNLGAVLLELHRYDEGLTTLETAARLDPQHAGVLVNLGNAYFRSGRATLAIDKYQEALAIDPTHVAALQNLVRPLLETCAWDALDAHLGRMKSAAGDGSVSRLPILPYDSLFLPFTRREQLDLARHAAAAWSRAAGAARRSAGVKRGERIRIGYLSSDFHDHATAHLTLGLYAAHDRCRFEIFAYSIGYPDASAYRQKIAHDCDAFRDVHERSAQEIAARIAADGIDILVDLKGYTGGSRPDILALRPAPIQVNYLGYPGTMGADFIDYLVADAVIVPESHAADYSERVIRLPGCYQATDDRQEIAAPLARAAAGLPQDGFVFCCFNTPAKIDRRSFGCWMKILAQIPNSVLWLMRSSPEAERRLADAARAAGVDPRRMIFAPPLPKAQHLARLQLADLVLDTFACNAHTTATDALWAGVPIVTLTGETFASRVATSLLDAVGLAELACRSEEVYVALAVGLAQDRERLTQARRTLAAKRSEVLFDTGRYGKRLEDAYAAMLEDRIS